MNTVLLLVGFLTVNLLSEAHGQLLKCILIENASAHDAHLVTVMTRLDEPSSIYHQHQPILIGPIAKKTNSSWIVLPNNASIIDSIEWCTGFGVVSMDIGKPLPTSGFFRLRFADQGEIGIEEESGTVTLHLIVKPYGYVRILKTFDAELLRFDLSENEERQALRILSRASLDAIASVPENFKAIGEVQSWIMGHEQGIFGGLFEPALIDSDWPALSQSAHDLETSGKGDPKKAVIRVMSAFEDGYKTGYEFGLNALKKAEAKRVQKQ